MTTQDTTTSAGRKARRKSTPRFGGFGRVSREGGRGDKLRSPELQEAAIRHFAAAEGIELAEVVIEVDQSGNKTDESKGLERLVRMVERGELDGIVVPKLDRLSRLKARQRVELVERIGNERLLSATESNDVSTPEGRFVRELFFSLARMEWERAAEGFATAKRNAVAKGVAVTATALFGYRFDEEHRRELVDDEAPIVRELFRKRAAGASYGDCLAYFERKTGRSSSRQTMREMLHNRAYLGENRYGRGEAAGGVAELVQTGAHPAIVEPELFEAVQAVNEARGRAHGFNYSAGKARAMLAGIAKCAGCGRGLRRSPGSGGRPAVYKCPADASACDARASVYEAELDAYVVAAVLEQVGPLADELVEVELEPADHAQAERRLEQAEEAYRAWATNLEEEERDPDAYAAGKEARWKRVLRRRAELAALGEASELEVARGTLRTALVDDSFNADERRRLLAIALDAVVVRRTPRRGAPIAERADILFAVPVLLDEDAAQLREQAPSEIVVA